MKECIHKYFIENGRVKKCEEFNEDKLKYGKSVYEVVRIIEGIPLFLERHMDRMRNSIGFIGRNPLLGEEQVKNSIYELLKENSLKEGNVKIVFNYGDSDNTTYFYFIKHHYPQTEQYEKGVETILYHGERETPNVKIINMSFREKVEKAISESHAYEAILVNNEGFITEGSKSNVFMAAENKIITAPVELVLPGVTRGIIIEIIKMLGIEMEEKKVSFKELHSLDGIFISGTSPKVLPVRSVDKISFASSQNPLINKIMKAYEANIQEYIRKSK